MEKLLQELQTELNKFNARFSIVSAGHVHELKEEIEELRSKGKISEEIYDAYVSKLQFEVPEGAKSIVIIAIPQGMSTVTFKQGGKSFDVIIPPTYIWAEARKSCKGALESVLENTGAKVSAALLPVKLLATKSGLAKYGRNNISYIEGMGSFARLEAFYTDYPFSTDTWQKAEMLETCENCKSCISNCPTQALVEEDTFVNAKRCITFFNRGLGDFPEWLNNSSHNALIGCLKCQIKCPQNQSFIATIFKKEEFSEEETNIILSGTPKDSMPSDTLNKLKQLNIEDFVLSRNLKVLLK